MGSDTEKLSVEQLNTQSPKLNLKANAIYIKNTQPNIKVVKATKTQHV